VKWVVVKTLQCVSGVRNCTCLIVDEVEGNSEGD
jgi:hypothetical protein